MKRASLICLLTAFVCVLPFSACPLLARGESGAPAEQKPGGGSEAGEEKEEGGVSMEWGGDEEAGTTGQIVVAGQGVSEVTVAGLKLRGQFVEQSPGVYLVQGALRPDWDFDITITGTGTLTVDTNKDRIAGQMYVQLPVLGKIVQVTDFVIAKSQLKFKGVFDETFHLGRLGIQVGQGVADFELSTKRIAVKANGAASLNVSGIPGIDTVKIEITSGDAGFTTSIPPEAIAVSGSGTVEIPFTPPIQVALSGKLKLKTTGVSGEGAAKIFAIEVGNGEFDLQTDGIVTLKLNAGIFKEGIVECNAAGMVMTADLRTRVLTAGITQELKIYEGIKIPGSTSATLTIDAKTKKMTVAGKAGISLTGSAVGPESLSLGIKDFLFDIQPYDSANPAVKISGDAYISIWTFAGFDGAVNDAILDGHGDLYLPPGLKQLLDIESVRLPVRVDLRSGRIMGELGGEVAGLAIKHFPLTGPQLIVRNDGVHLKGQIGIANVITIPLGDLVFKKDERYTKVSGDIGIGPFTVARGEATFPTGDRAGIAFDGTMGIPGLRQKISGFLYSDGTAELGAVSSFGMLKVTNLSKFAVSKTKLHADEASLALDLGGLAECSLALTDLDITPQSIKGAGTASFRNVIGVKGALSGSFSFDGTEAVVEFPEPISLCGIDVRDCRLTVGGTRLTGSGKIVSPAGRTITVSISIENGKLILKDPALKVIATGYDIAKDFAGTLGDIASDEKETVAEDAGDALANLERMADPWAKEAAAAIREVRDLYKDIERLVSGKIIAKAKTYLADLKKDIDRLVAAAKKAIDGAVDTFCDAALELTARVRAMLAKLDALVPKEFKSLYDAAKEKVRRAAADLDREVERFRAATKYTLYHATDAITAVYQQAIDRVTEAANLAAQAIKKEMDPRIAELDRLLAETGAAIDRATGDAGDEAQEQYARAKAKAEEAKRKADGIIEKYKNKIDALVGPYVDQAAKDLKPYYDAAEKAKNRAIEDAFTAFGKAQEELQPYLDALKEGVSALEEVARKIGGAFLEKFCGELKAAGDAFNKAVGKLGAGLVKVTDIVGDAFVRATAFMADVSNAAHDAAVALKNALAEAARAIKAEIVTIFTDVFNRAVSLQEAIDTSLRRLENTVRQKVDAVAGKIPGTYTVEGMTVTIARNGDVTLACTVTVLGKDVTFGYAGGTVTVSAGGDIKLGGFPCGNASFTANSKGVFSASGTITLPWAGSTSFTCAGTAPAFTATATKQMKIAGKTQDVTFTVANNAVSGQATFDLPLFGQTAVAFSGGPGALSGSATKSVTILGKTQSVALSFGNNSVSGSADFDLPLFGTSAVTFTGDANGLAAKTTRSMTIAGNTQSVEIALTTTSASGAADFDLPVFGTTNVVFSGGPSGVTGSAHKSLKLAGRTQTVDLAVTPSSVAGEADYDLPLFGTTTVHFTGDASSLTGSASKSITIAGKAQTVALTVGTGGISGAADFDLPVFGTTTVTFTGNANGLTASAQKALTLAGQTQTVNLSITPSSITGTATFDLPVFGSTQFAIAGNSAGLTATADLASRSIGGATFTGNVALSGTGAVGTGSVKLGSYTFSNATITVSSGGAVTVQASQSFSVGGKSVGFTLQYANGSFAATGSADVSLGSYAFSGAFTMTGSGVTVSGSNTFSIGGKSITFNLQYANGSYSASGTANLTVAGVGFNNCSASISSSGTATVSGTASITYYYPSPTLSDPFRIGSGTATATLSYANGKFSYSY